MVAGFVITERKLLLHLHVELLLHLHGFMAPAFLIIFLIMQSPPRS
jgi:hypothetical protein